MRYLRHFCLDLKFDLYQVEIAEVVEVFSSHVLVSSNLSYYVNFLIQADSSLFFECHSRKAFLLFCDDNYINVSYIQM